MAEVLAASLGVRDLTNAFSFATDWLGVHVDEVNALNVYPVPDGDTGTNMHLTMQSVRRQFAAAKPSSMIEFAQALAHGSLLGARGNSGVILSQVLKGFADTARLNSVMGSDELVAALAASARSAYAAVLKPVEGTILTVVRRVAEAAELARPKRPLEILRDAHEGGVSALRETPDLLPILKAAGVVDAGGLGFLRVLEGLIAFFEGRDLPAPPVVTIRAQQQFSEQEFGYCTEFLLSDATLPTGEIQKLMEPFGDSLLVVGTEGFVKGHIHTEEPERLLALVARHGTMVQSKVEDMTEQHSEILGGLELTTDAQQLTGLVAVSDGYGLTKAFRSMGARVVGGGQTSNPSVEDIADAVRSVSAPGVIILPNNSNIVLAAQRVAELLPEKDIRVLPTTTVGAGLAAAVTFEPQRDLPVDAVLANLQRAAAGSLTLEVTTATRSVQLNGVTVTEGSFIGLADNELRVSAATAPAALLSMLEGEADNFDVATLFYNASSGAEGASQAAELIGSEFPHLELEVHAGGPDIYEYLLILE
jgi:DAK2 domain fusion protein YloV